MVLESTYGWYRAADLLQDLGANVHLAHALGNNWGTRRVINDERDAQDLAAMLRIGRLTEAWIAPPEVREPRELVRYRYSSVRHRTSAKAQIHRVMAKNGILPVVGELWGPISTIDHRLRDGRGYRVLVRLPGVGKVIVSIFVAEIGDVRPRARRSSRNYQIGQRSRTLTGTALYVRRTGATYTLLRRVLHPLSGGRRLRAGIVMGRLAC